MSLLTTYSDTNLNYGEGPNVTFEVQPSYYTATSSVSGQFQLPLYWQIVRKSTRSYTYVGMTKATAVTCANELRAKYTRSYADWSANVSDGNGNTTPDVFVSQNYVTKCTADINISNTAGDAYQVDVTEDDTDTVISLTELKTDEEFANIFQLADSRTATVGTIAVTAAHWRYYSITVDFEPIVGATYDKTLVTVQVKSGSAWEEATVSSRPSNTRIIFTSETNATFRLVYNASGATPIYSKEWTTTDPAVPTITLVESESTATSTRQSASGSAWSSATEYNIVFTSDAEFAGSMLGLSDYVLFVNGRSVTSAFNSWAQAEGGLKSVQSLGGNKFMITASGSSFSVPYCDGAYPASVSLFYGRFDISSENTITVKPKHYIDIVSATASGLGSHASITINFKSSENSETVLANAVAWKHLSTTDFTQITKTSITYDASTQTYTFVGSSYIVPEYGQSVAVIHMTLPMGSDPTIIGAWNRLEFTPTVEPRIEAILNSVPANTTVTPQVTTAMTGYTFDWDWGDGTVETGLTSSPAAHTYLEAGNYTIVASGGIAAIQGVTAAPWNRCWLAGAESYIKTVTITGNVELKPRAFYTCTKLSRFTANDVTTVDGAVFYRAGVDLTDLGTMSLRSATSVGTLTFDGAAFASVNLTAATSIGANALRFVTPETEVTIGKTKTEVQAMDNYPFGMIAGNLIHCTDGDILI